MIRSLLGGGFLILTACTSRIQPFFLKPAEVSEEILFRMELIDVQPETAIRGEGITIRQVTALTDRGRITTYPVSGILIAEDQAFRFTIGLAPMNLLERRFQMGGHRPFLSLATVNMLTVFIENKTWRRAEIRWDQVGMWIDGHRPMRVVHSGIPLSDERVPLKPTVIPPQGKIEEFLFPVELIRRHPGEKGWEAQRFLETLTVGERVYLLLPIKLGSFSLTRYRFTFEITRPEEIRPFLPSG